MTTRLISTGTEPVTAVEVKTLISLDGTDHDTRIDLLIPALRQQAEQITGRSFAVNTWQTKLDAFPCEIMLPWPPLVSVTAISYIDESGVAQTLDPADYSVDSHSEPAWVLPAADTDWPATLDTANAVTVDYTAGAGAGAPEEVKLWIAARIRADIDGCAVPDYLDGLLDRLKVY
jgi:uncharacterized phiE125 gp8 family phage protein